MTATRHECVSKDLFLQKYKGLMFRCFKSRKKGLGNCIWLLRLFETIKINCCNDFNFIFFFQVRLTPDSLILSPTRTDDDHTLPGLCCICPGGCGRCCLPRGPDEVLKCSDIVACRPAQQDDAAQYMKKRFKDILSFNH